MEVLIKQISLGILVPIVGGGVGWMPYTLINVDKRTAIMSIKIDQNNRMLTPLWEEFIKQRVRNEQVTNEKASIVWR